MWPAFIMCGLLWRFDGPAPSSWVTRDQWLAHFARAACRTRRAKITRVAVRTWRGRIRPVGLLLPCGRRLHSAVFYRPSAVAPAVCGVLATTWHVWFSLGSSCRNGHDAAVCRATRWPWRSPRMGYWIEMAWTLNGFGLLGFSDLPTLSPSGFPWHHWQIAWITLGYNHILTADPVRASRDMLACRALLPWDAHVDGP